MRGAGGSRATAREGRVADAEGRWTAQRAHALLAPRSDHRGQLQQARSGLAFQDRQPRSAPRVQPAIHAADGWRPAVFDRRNTSCRGRARRGDGRAAVGAQRGGRRAGAAAPRQLSGRGLAYWTDGKEERILYVTPGYRLVALDAKTGNRVPAFGSDGIVDLKADLDRSMDLTAGPIGLHATPIVAGDVVLVGAAFETGANPRSKSNIKGAVRAFDVRTGKRLWMFKTIPEPGEVGAETWEDDSWAYTGNTGVWAQISVDLELGMAYLPVEMPTHDYYGGTRPGNNLFGETPGRCRSEDRVRKWHYQLVHHGIWDMDIPCAPILADITVNGRTIKAVAQPTKQAFLYVFDRVTGQPIWPIEERPVPQGDTPGEKYSKTQPFPTKPAAYNRQGLAIDDLIDFTPELRAEAVKAIEKYKIGPIFTPPVVSNAEGPIATLQMASQGAATNWPGGSYDPETHILYVQSQSAVATLGLVPPPPGAAPDVRYHQGTVLSGARRQVARVRIWRSRWRSDGA